MFNYESPINFIVSELAPKITEQGDKIIYETIQSVICDVDKDELIKVLAYSRNQYDKGYKDAKRKYEEALDNKKKVLSGEIERLFEELANIDARRYEAESKLENFNDYGEEKPFTEKEWMNLYPHLKELLEEYERMKLMEKK